MIYSVLTKIECCLPIILNQVGINIKECKISDYKNLAGGEKAFVLIGDGRKITPALQRLVALHGRNNFDWCYVMGA